MADQEYVSARLDERSVYGEELSRQITRVAYEYGLLSEALYKVAARTTEIGSRPTSIAEVITASRLAEDAAQEVTRAAAQASLAPIVKAASDYDRHVPSKESQ